MACSYVDHLFEMILIMVDEVSSIHQSSVEHSSDAFSNIRSWLDHIVICWSWVMMVDHVPGMHQSKIEHVWWCIEPRVIMTWSYVDRVMISSSRACITQGSSMFDDGLSDHHVIMSWSYVGHLVIKKWLWLIMCLASISESWTHIYSWIERHVIRIWS